MKKLIMYDSTESESLEILPALTQALSAETTIVESLDLAAASLKPCLGCFGCWIKTPGLCVHKTDGGDEFLRKLVHTDELIILSRIQWGGYSTKVKEYVDRMLPLLHPYFRTFNGEMHHRLRYGKMPRLLVVGFGAKSRAEEECFISYTESHRNNIGGSNLQDTFICNSHKAIPEKLFQ